jgi:hypothetical protein
VGCRARIPRFSLDAFVKLAPALGRCVNVELRPAVPQRAAPTSGFSMVKATGLAVPPGFNVVRLLKPEPARQSVRE